ncbi:MAG: MarR family transcriptional regulator [Burkholderiales bacterium]|nr:MarR family transcriptional regulator [Phycisphaerae bacterium]
MTAGRKSKLRILSGYDVPSEGRGHAALITLVRVFNRMTALSARMAKQHGTTLPQFEVLLCLYEGEGISQQDLAERLLLTKGNICIMMQKMEKAGLIERRPDPVDQRFQRLYLTRAGRELHAAILPDHIAQWKASLQRLTLPEQKTLHELLCRIHDTLREADE